MTDDGKRKYAEVSWSGDEIQLLLESVLEFKSKCEFEGIDWESNIRLVIFGSKS